MSEWPVSKSAQQLFALLPEVYRTRDSSGQLAGYLDALGGLLDQLRGSLDQRLKDNFPSTCQPWLLPYFGDLLDVRFVSPAVEGKRKEVEHAIDWRQRKGTIGCIEEIAREVGQMDVEVREGWKHVAVTTRVGETRLSAIAFGEAGELDDTPHPFYAAKHPALPAVTPDLRQPSRAVQRTLSEPVTNKTRIMDKDIEWRQLHPHGAPCFPGSYEDASLRTVDVRSPDQNAGHIHPKRVLLFVPTPDGFFSSGMQKKDVFTANETKEYRLEDMHIKKLNIQKGQVILIRCAVENIESASPGQDGAPVVQATDCLIGALKMKEGKAQLEYCTVLHDVTTPQLLASDCIFMGKIENASKNWPDGCIRYSRVNELKPLVSRHQAMGNTTARPLFLNDTWGEPGCGVLDPATSNAVSQGAEDGGEMGTFHHLQHCLLRDAILRKLKDYLPVGMRPALVLDNRLKTQPPNLDTN
ncbi:MAG: phage tail protein [Hydrogenophilales bacterium]|nr:phage tail protein [Hydrogenophilales bacterium]